jgi:dihydrodipicolinate synthase/N-acetylneuraminate lyase
VAASGRDFSPTVMLRGAEGGYAEAVTGGGYDGWLLSTANVFGKELRQVEAALRSGKTDEARALSDRLGGIVSSLFDAAADETGANAFSNANRAADHLRAYGARWEAVPPPLKQNGEPLAVELVERAAKICKELIDLDGAGYLNQ